MYEAIEQALNHLRSIWQYRWVVIATAWLITLSGWVWVHYLPDQYQASTRVYIDSDSILRPLMKGLAVETDVEQQMKLMTRTLLTRPNIEKIMRMTDMDIKVKTPDEKEQMISRLTDAVEINKLGKEKEINLYQINYMDSDRNLAKQVVQSLLTILVESNLGDKRKDSDSAKVFINEEIEKYEARLIASEDRLTKFKKDNIGVLPGQEGDYYESLRVANINRDKAMLELREARDRRDTAKTQIKELIERERLSNEDNMIAKSPIKARILALQTKLDNMLLVYTEQYPSVQELKNMISELENQLKEEGQESANGGEEILTDNPLYQELKLTLGNEEANVAALESRVEEYSKRIQHLQSQLETLPQIETELKRLSRDYNVNKNNYDALIARRESANLASRVEQTGDSIKFRVIDPPWVPYSASEPNRFVLNSLVLLAGIAGGLGMGFILGQIHPTIYDRKTLQDITGVPVWGAVSLALTDSQVSRKKRQLAIITGTFLLLIMAYGIIMVYELKQKGLLTGLMNIVEGWTR